MIIPHSEIAPETLRSIVEEFVTREGTDYGETELALDEKVDRLLSCIKDKTVLIVFNEELESVNLVRLEDYDNLDSGGSAGEPF